MLPEGLATSTRMTHIALRSSNHDQVPFFSLSYYIDCYYFQLWCFYFPY